MRIQRRASLLAVLPFALAACDTARPPIIGAPPEVKLRTTAAPKAVGYTIAATRGTVQECVIAISPANPRIAVAAGMEGSLGTKKVQPFWSDDGGATWHYSEPLDHRTAKVEYVGSGDPVVAIDRTGTAYVATLIKRPVGTNQYGRSGIALWKSTDGGRTWSAPLPVVERSGEHFDDKEWLGVDTSGGPNDGTLYMAWLRADSAQNYTRVEMVFVRSKDGGQTWSDEKVLARGGGPQFAIGPDGEVHITFAIGLEMVSITSRDGGETFSDPVKIATIAGPNGNLPNTKMFLYPFASTGADRSNGPYRGHLYTVWPGSADAYPNLGSSLPGTVWLSRSTDGGRSWSAPMKISNPASGRDAMFPSLAVDPANGAVVVAWLDRSDDPQNKVARIYAARSFDGGATFSAPRAFTSPVDVSGDFLGHYNGSAAQDGVWLTVFSDSGGYMGVARLSFPDEASGGRRRSVRH